MFVACNLWSVEDWITVYVINSWGIRTASRFVGVLFDHHHVSEKIVGILSSRHSFQKAILHKCIKLPWKLRWNLKITSLTKGTSSSKPSFLGYMFVFGDLISRKHMGIVPDHLLQTCGAVHGVEVVWTWHFLFKSHSLCVEYVWICSLLTTSTIVYVFDLPQ